MTDGSGDCGHGAHVTLGDSAGGGNWLPGQMPTLAPIDERPQINGAPVIETTHEYVIRKDELPRQ